MSNNPQVKWHQKDSLISLSIEVTDVKKETVKTVITETSVYFHAETNSGTIEFKLPLSKKVDPTKYDTKIKDRRIKVVIAKHDDCLGEWARITPEKPRWLKFDVDSVELTDEETIAARKLADARTRLEAEHGPLPKDTAVKRMSDMNGEDIARDLENAEKELYDMMKKTYLTIYNGVIWLGYFYVFFVSILRVAIEGKGAIATNYAAIGWLLKSCQETMFLELVHSALGLTKTHFMPSFLQVVGRAVVLYCVVETEPELQTSVACYLLVVSWCAIEVVRYPYYVVKIYQWYFPKLTWLRYTVWIPLYPLGLVCEAYLVYQCIDKVRESGRLTVEMPNKLNVAFNFSKYLTAHLGAILLGGLFLMQHMAVQRSRAMKTLCKLEQVRDVHRKQNELNKIRNKKEEIKSQ